MSETLETTLKFAKACNLFEKCNTETKKQYILDIIKLFIEVANKFEECKGTFGTGHPFYALSPDLSGELPVIEEQLRYNQELENAVLEDYKKYRQFREWKCANCLKENDASMPDLKQVCKPCSQIEDIFKPREAMKRAPDMDLWFIFTKDIIEAIIDRLQEALTENGFITSDVDPVKTMHDIIEIAECLQNNERPKILLPIDTHIIDYDTINSLVNQVPDVLDYALKHGEKPYLAISPYSYRKGWNKPSPEESYNFIKDFIFSFTYFDNMDISLKNNIDNVRKYIKENYSVDELIEILKLLLSDAELRRFNNPVLQKCFVERFISFGESNSSNNGGALCTTQKGQEIMNYINQKNNQPDEPTK